MNYLLFICSDGVGTPEKAEAMREHLPGWVKEMNRQGVRRFGHPLAPPGSAVTVRVRDRRTLVSDGPFAESKEFVGGFDLIRCTDLDEAIEVASAHPASWFHGIEIRPFADSPLGQSGAAGESEGALESSVSRLNHAPSAGRQRYLMLIYVDGVAESDETEAAIRRDAASWVAEVQGSGVGVYGHALQGAETATTVRVRGGETIISDGPFLETKEFVGGFDVLDCPSRQEAVEVAARHPLARYHLIEVRPFDEVR